MAKIIITVMSDTLFWGDIVTDAQKYSMIKNFCFEMMAYNFFLTALHQSY